MYDLNFLLNLKKMIKSIDYNIERIIILIYK